VPYQNPSIVSLLIVYLFKSRQLLFLQMAPLLPLHKPSLQIHKNFEKNFLRTRHPANDSGCDTSINSSNFLLLDISKDLNYVAFVDTNFRLYVYNLKNGNDELKLSGRHIIKEDLPMEHLNIKNTYLFLSVSSEGHAVVSSLKVDQHGNPIYRNMQQNKSHKEGTASKEYSDDEKDIKNDFKGCRVFRHGFQGNLDIEFNGRAVYVDDRLVLVNTNSVCIHRRWNYSLLDIHKGIADLVRVKKLDPPKVSWAYYISGKLSEDKGVQPPKENAAQPPKDNAAQKIISMTQLIKDEILMTFYSCNITKVWSLFDGSLITSIVLKEEESVMAVSLDRLHLATYNRKQKRVNLYDTETLLKLHSLSPKGIKMGENHSRVRAVRFCHYQHYLFIAGINVYGDKAETFFEVWLIEKERCIANSKNDGTFTRSPCPVIDITELKKYYSMNTTSETTFYNVEFKGTFVNGFQDINEIGIKKTLIFEQKPSGIQGNMLWGKYKCMKIEKKQNEDKGIYYEITAPPIKDGEPLGKENALYVLRFGQRTVRLWELTATIEGSNNNKVLDFLNSVDEKYKDKSANLIFIRAYKGHHTESNFKDIWKISQQKNDESHIGFMNDAGRILVDVEDAHSNKASKDEFFLPLPKLDRQPTNDFNEIESLSQALYCLYYDHKAPKEVIIILI
jgi:hypothetical protein